MEIEWDEAKRKINKSKHGIDFSEVFHFDFDSALEFDDTTHATGEIRAKLIGPLNNAICVLVITIRGENTRVISLRYATRKETASYVRYLE